MSTLSVTTYQFGGTGTLTANLITQNVSANIDLGDGIHVGTAQLKNFSLPDVDLEEALAAVVGLTPTVQPNYTNTRDLFLQKHPGAYFSSERFTDFATPSTLVNDAVMGVATAGASVQGSALEAKDILLAEVDDILSWAETTGMSQALTPAFFEKFVTAATTNQKVDLGGFSFIPVNVNYKASFTGGPLGYLTSGASIDVPHLAFAIVPTSNVNPPTPATLLAGLANDEQMGVGALYKSLVGSSTIASVLAGTPFALSDLPGFLNLKPLLDQAVSKVQGYIDGSSPIVNLMNSPLKGDLQAMLGHLALGNEGSAEVDEFELNLTTMEFQVRFKVESKQIWDFGDSLAQGIRWGIKNAESTINDVTSRAAALFEREKQAAIAAQTQAIQDLQANLADAESQFNKVSDEWSAVLRGPQGSVWGYAKKVARATIDTGVGSIKAAYDLAKSTLDGLEAGLALSTQAIDDVATAALNQAQKDSDALLNSIGSSVQLLADGSSANPTSTGGDALAPSSIGGDVFSVAANQSVYDLKSDGSLWTGHADSSGSVNDWRQIDGNVRSYVVRPDGLLDVLKSDGTLNLGNAGGWVILLSDIQDFKTGADGKLIYGLKTDGRIVRVSTNPDTWQSIASGIISFSVSADGTLYTLDRAGNYQRGDGFQTGSAGHWTLVDINVKLAGDGSLYRNDLVFGKQPTTVMSRGWDGVWTPILSDVASFNVGSDGQVYALGNGGEYQCLSLRNGPGMVTWTTEATNVRSVIGGGLYRLGDDETLYRLGDGTNPWTGSPTDWRVVDTDVRTYSVVPSDASVYELKADGSLVHLTSSGPVEVAEDVAAVFTGWDLVGYLKVDGTYWIRDATTGNLGLSRSGVSIGADAQLYALSSDGTLERGTILSSSTSWRTIASNVASFNVTSGGQITTLSNGGELAREQVSFLNGSLTSTVMREGVRSMALSANGTSLYVLESNGQLSQVASATGQWTGMKAGVQAFSLSTDGQTLYVLEISGLFSRVALTGGQWSVMSDGVLSFGLSVDGQSLFVLSKAGVLSQVALSTGQWSVLNGSQQSFALAPDGHTVYLLTNDGTLTQLSLLTGQWTPLHGGVRSFGLSLNGLSLYILDNAGVLSRDALATGQWTGMKGGVQSIALSPNGMSLYVLENSGVLSLVALNTGQWTGMKGGVKSFSLSPNGQTLYVLENSGQLSSVALATGQWTGMKGGVQSIALSPNGMSLYVLENSGVLSLVALNTGQWTGMKGGVKSFSLSPNGQTLYVLENSGQLSSVALATGQWTGMKGGVQSIALSPNGMSLYVLENSGVLSLVALNTGQWTGMKGGVKSFSLSPNGQTLYVLENSGQLSSVALATGQWTGIRTDISSFVMWLDGQTLFLVDKNGASSQLTVSS